MFEDLKIMGKKGARPGNPLIRIIEQWNVGRWNNRVIWSDRFLNNDPGYSLYAREWRSGTA